MPTGGARRLQVDPIRCDGRGLCAELLPELIAVDDWGYPMVRKGSVPPELLDLAARAVRLCPVLALRLEPAPSVDARRPVVATQKRYSSR